ncbi:MAG: SpoVA/SpoVAEb family sporulation membrane protein [Bacilli bacterium]|nr:SpoVA/SpoVAEb family sporulation membrane protein [Bacilli bacterium]
MEKTKYKNLINKHTPKEDVFYNAVIAFITGGIMGIIGQGLIDFYSYYLTIPAKEATVCMLVTLIFFSCLFTSLGFFDKWVNFAKCGLIIPITGFAHATMSAALEYRKEGLVTGIGANMLKLSGAVVIFGVVSAWTFSIIRMIVGAI